MKRYFTLIALAVALVACDQKKEETTEEPAAEEAAPAEETEEAPPAAEEAAEAEETGEAGSADTVEVAADGTKFQPPIKPEKLPEGAWYCDMGTVHYAQMEKGEAKCPVCGMKLKQHASAE